MSAAPRILSRLRLAVALLVVVGAGLGCTEPNSPNSGPLGPAGSGSDDNLDPLPPDNPFEPPPIEVGRIKVKTFTSGFPIDGTGWVVNIQGGPSAAIGINSTVVVEDVPEGDRLISLDGLASNCALSQGDNPRRLTVVASLAAQTEFHVACSNPGTRAVGG
jgi:hypothetical protein